MKGDFTRSTFRANNHYSSVRLQQGRVQLDADWNEQVDIQAYREQTTNNDIIGPCGVSITNRGFEIGVRPVQLWGVHFVNNQRGWAVGGGFSPILFTDDGGDTWTQQSSPAGMAMLMGVHFVNDQRGWAVGWGSTILFTDDSGDSWTQQLSPVTVLFLIGVHFVNNQRGWAVGSNGTILFTDNGGENWTEQTAPPAVRGELLWGVHFVNDQSGWVVGSNGTILFTDDGGENWEPQSPPNAVRGELLCGVHFVNNQRGWAVGSNGTILFTDNGGENWTEQTAPPAVRGEFLYGVHFVNNQRGWAVGSNGTILFTNEGDKDTWTQQTAPPAVRGQYLTGVHFVNDQRGWAVGPYGTILFTDDAGDTWTADNLSANLTISPGHIYVDGILCELETETTYLNQPDYPRVPRTNVEGSNYLAYLDVWPRHLTTVERPELREVALGGPDTATRTQTIWQVKLEKIDADDTCNSFGSEWVPAGAQSTGRLRAWAEPSTEAVDGKCLVPPGGGYRGLENQLYRLEIHEGGAPYTWPRPAGVIASDVSAITNGNHVQVTDETWNLDSRPWQEGQRVELYSDETDAADTAGTLAQITTVDASSFTVTLDVDVTDLADHTTLRLRRVATCKWSRDNGSMVARLTEMNETNSVIAVSHSGQDKVLGFQGARWVEVSDEERILAGKPGILYEVEAVQENKITVKDWPSGVTRDIFGKQATVRRWEGTGAITPETAVELEDGVWIEFADGQYRTGDYWLIPARSLTGEVEWTQDETGPQFERRHGIEHHYCSLALLEFNGTTWTATNCRRRFPSLTELTGLLYESGDGQEARPGQVLAQPLRVRVANGQFPVIGAQVRFTVESGGGRLSVSVPVPTIAPDGIAECTWTLGRNGLQQVKAVLLDADEQPIDGQIVHFNANLSVADEVAYEPTSPSDCADLVGAGTVQEALDRLCARPTGGHDPYWVVRHMGGDGQEGQPGETLPCPLVVGVEDEQGHPVEGAPVRFKAIFDDDTLTDAQYHGTSGNDIYIKTDDRGVAEVMWTFGRQEGCHQVVVQLLGPPQGEALDLRFEAVCLPEWPRVVDIKWENDQPMHLNQFNEGLTVIISEQMNPVTASLNSFIVSLELVERDPVAGFKSYRPTFIHGTVSEMSGDPSFSVWLFKPEPEIDEATLKDWLASADSESIRCRVTLKGNVILDAKGERPLDGDVFGLLRQDGTTDLHFPSGDGDKGGDFESWFFLAGD